MRQDICRVIGLERARNFCLLKDKQRLSKKYRLEYICSDKGEVMKTINRWLKMAPEDVAVLLGFTIGLGLTVHQIFFVPALLVVLIVVGEWTLEKTHECLRDLHVRPRRP
jgi:hypothetical protein